MSDVDIIIGAGGTGGHLYPGVAIAGALRDLREDMEIGFVITSRPSEEQLMEELGYKYWKVCTRPLLGGFNLSLIRNIFMNIISLFQSFFILMRSGAEMVIGMGGYLSGPLFITATILQKKRVIFEQNIIPGFTNRVLSHLSHISFTSFPETELSGRVEITGNPLRRGILKERDKSLENFGLSDDRKTILIMGGSQGAHSINLAIMEAFRSGWGDEYQFIVQTGEEDYRDVLEVVEEMGIQAVVRGFYDDMGSVYGAGDLYIGRAGSTVYEVLNAGLPMILIPYPYSASSHQQANARYIVDEGAGVIVGDDELSGDMIIEKVEMILKDEDLYEDMRNSCGELARPNSAEVASLKILELMER